MKKTMEVNVRLIEAIEKHFGSVSKMCRTWPGLKEIAGSPSIISALVHFRESPLCANGTFSRCCQLVSEALGVLPEKLFPVELYTKVISFNLEVTAVYPLMGKAKRELLEIVATTNNPLEEITAEALQKRILKAMKTLTYREREIIKLRFGLNDGPEYTYEEVSRIFKVTGERIRQIEAKAMRKLQQPTQSQKLAGFLD